MHHHHNHGSVEGATLRRKALLWAFGINAAFLLVEVIGGLLSGSLALLADAGHMLSDVSALAIALWVAHIVTRPPSRKRTFGYGRAEVLSGLLNGLALWIVVAVIFVEAYHRFGDPQQVDVSIMLPVAIAGLLANVASAWVLMGHRHHDLNVRGAFLHLVADAVGSIGAIGAALAIHFGGWAWADPLASVLIGGLILYSSWGLIRESLHILLEGSPPGVKIEDVRDELDALEGVASSHDLHLWLVGSGEPMMSVHLVIEDGCSRDRILTQAQSLMEERFAIHHCTFQLEGAPCAGLHQ